MRSRFSSSRKDQHDGGRDIQNFWRQRFRAYGADRRKDREQRTAQYRVIARDKREARKILVDLKGKQASKLGRLADPVERSRVAFGTGGP